MTTKSATTWRVNEAGARVQPVLSRRGIAMPRIHASEGGSAAAAVPGTRSSSLAALLSGQVLRDGEVVLLVRKPSLWFILFQSLRFTAAVVAALLAARIVGDRFGMMGFSQKFVLLETAIFLTAGRVMYAIMQWMGRLYVLTDQRVIRLAGLFTVDLFDCPLRRIAGTEVSANFRERIVGLGTIHIHPRDSAEDCNVGSWQTVADPEDVNAQIQAAIHRALG